MSLEHELISPFEPQQISQGIISYGLSSCGYDIRLAPEYFIFPEFVPIIVDPKNFNLTSLTKIENDYCTIPPNSFILGRTIEYFRIPRNIAGIVMGKSTYARCGLVLNTTPLEPGWEGEITLELSNTTPLPVKVYGNEGIGQVTFEELDGACEIAYNDRKGKYQGQKGITFPRIK